MLPIERRAAARRWLWFVALWSAGVLVTAALSALARLLL